METWQIESKLGVLRDSVQPILAYSQRELKDFTTHGEDHSEGIESLLTEIISRCETEGGNCAITPFERYIMVCAAWLHDIGNVLGRDLHNEKTCDIITKLVPTHIEGLDPDFVEFVKWICLYHCKNTEIDDVPLQIPYRGGNIRLRYLTAIFRLADAGDMDNRRAPIGVFEIIKDQLTKKSIGIWRSHQAIRDVSFLSAGRSIIVTVKDKRIASWALRDFKAEFTAVESVLRQYDFPYQEIVVVRESKAPYRGRVSLAS
jgi:hypothetical protein